jgi:hypothetical protein
VKQLLVSYDQYLQYVYRDVVAESGAIEEITGLLSQPSLTPEVSENYFIK